MTRWSSGEKPRSWSSITNPAKVSLPADGAFALQEFQALEPAATSQIQHQPKATSHSGQAIGREGADLLQEVGTDVRIPVDQKPILTQHLLQVKQAEDVPLFSQPVQDTDIESVWRKPRLLVKRDFQIR